jgi:hypothetical protein
MGFADLRCPNGSKRCRNDNRQENNSRRHREAKDGQDDGHQGRGQQQCSNGKLIRFQRPGIHSTQVRMAHPAEREMDGRLRPAAGARSQPPHKGLGAGIVRAGKRSVAHAYRLPSAQSSNCAIPGLSRRNRRRRFASRNIRRSSEGRKRSASCCSFSSSSNSSNSCHPTWRMP